MVKKKLNTCQICGKEFKNLRSLAQHLGFGYISIRDYYNKYLKKDPREGVCIVCGKETKFVSLKNGYSQYCSRQCSNNSKDLIEHRKANYKRNFLKKYGVENPSQVPEIKEKRKQTFLKQYGVECPFQSEEVQNKAKQTCLEKYGVKYPSQSENIKEKKKKTFLEHYGVKYPSQSEEIKEKIKRSNLEKYGVEYSSQSEEIKEKKKKTFLEHYGVECPLQSQEIKEKSRQTCLKKYGVKSPSQSKEIKEKIRHIWLKKYGVEHPLQLERIKEKSRQTCLKKYGVKSPSQSKEIKEKIRHIWLKKYGVEHPSQSIEVKKKMLDSYHAKFLKQLELYLKELQIELLDKEYQHAHFNHRWKCLKCGHEFTRIWNSIQQGYLCPKCYPRPCGSSKQEEELTDFVKSLGVDVIKHDRTLIKPLELDIVIPNHKMAIEYNGLYWHSEEHVGKDYHFKKTKMCQSQGYQLIHIFEDEWILKKDIVKARLKYILGKTKDCSHIGARECTIKKISNNEKNDFLEQFHIQGPDISKVKLGAFYQNQLVAVMTFSHGSLAKGIKKQDPLVWELSRFCTNYNFVISGIASKLLEYFKRNYKWEQIFSYADLRWSFGKLYEQLGFQLNHTTSPNYYYWDGVRRIHRFSLRKRADEPKDIPEYILRLKEGYSRVWDCGNLKFVMYR